MQKEFYDIGKRVASGQDAFIVHAKLLSQRFWEQFKVIVSDQIRFGLKTEALIKRAVGKYQLEPVIFGKERRAFNQIEELSKLDGAC